MGSAELGRAGTRDRILDAAARVIIDDGLESLTIAGVAAAAGVSKGGLFYHFASKEELVAGITQRAVAAFDEAIRNAGNGPGAVTQVYLADLASAEELQSQVVIAMLAAALSGPVALEELRRHYRSWQDRLNDDGIDPTLALTIRLLSDGLWVAHALNLAPPSPAQRQAVAALARELVESPSSRTGGS